jgi:hypothetical protein
MIKHISRLLFRNSTQATEISKERRFHRDMSRLLVGVTIVWVAALSYAVVAALM